MARTEIIDKVEKNLTAGEEAGYGTAVRTLTGYARLLAIHSGIETPRPFATRRGQSGSLCQVARNLQ